VGSLYLVQNLDYEKSEDSLTSWAQRPFQYSSAVNPSVADIVVDILLCMVGKDSHSRTKILDPTCGSGTFLAFAVSRGAIVEGWDLNEACVKGCNSNLNFVASTDHVIRLQDATMPNLSGIDHSIDGVVANFPWGQNSIAYLDENKSILRNIATLVPPQTPCAFVTKTISLQQDMKALGYQLVGHAHVPPKDFELPMGNKQQSKRHRRSSSDCVITIAFSPG